MECLNGTGSSSALRRQLFPLGFAGEVMQLVLETWQKFSLHREVRLEGHITAVFRDALIDAYVAAGRSWIITLEEPVTDPTFGKELGRNDLRFLPPFPHHYGQKVFFTVECKRLHVTTDSGFRHLADEYVKEGLQRFVDGKYSLGLPCGGMLGYVMDNRTADAFARVCNEIKSQWHILKMKNARLYSPSSILPDQPHSVDTIHHRPDGMFAIYHLLVGVIR
jgi:hypothetical protein